MRQIFSVRFFAAVGAVVGLFLLLSVAFGGGDRIAEMVEPEPLQRRLDLVERVFAPLLEDFELGADGVTRGSLELVLDAERIVQVVEGTHGEISCEELDRIGACAVLAELLGDAVVWFALVPMGPGDTVEMPAIDVLEEDFAVLVNGWRVRYPRALDRRCPQEFASYREFRAELGDDFTSIYSLDEDRLVAVRCHPETLTSG